jgi:hypothetical protein
MDNDFHEDFFFLFARAHKAGVKSEEVIRSVYMEYVSSPDTLKEFKAALLKWVALCEKYEKG